MDQFFVGGGSSKDPSNKSVIAVEEEEEVPVAKRWSIRDWMPVAKRSSIGDWMMPMEEVPVAKRWSIGDWMMPMEEEEEVRVAKRWSIGNRMMRMEEEVLAAKRFSYELRNLFRGRSWSWSRSEFDKLEARIWKLKTEYLKTEYHQRKRTELDQVAAIWIDIKKLKEEDHISTEKMQALMSHFRSILGYFAGNGFHPTSPFDHTFRFYCSALLREVAAYSEELIPQIGNPMAMDVHIDIDEPGANSFVRTTFEKNISPSDTHISNNNTPTVADETNGTGGATTSSGGLIIPYMPKHFVRFIIFAVLSYAALYLLLPDDGGRGITHVVRFWMMAFQVYFMAIIVYSYSVV